MQPTHFVCLEDRYGKPVQQATYVEFLSGSASWSSAPFISSRKLEAETKKRAGCSAQSAEPEPRTMQKRLNNNTAMGFGPLV